MTADWNQIKIHGEFLNFSEYDQNGDHVYHFTVGDDSYDLGFDVS